MSGGKNGLLRASEAAGLGRRGASRPSRPSGPAPGGRVGGWPRRPQAVGAEGPRGLQGPRAPTPGGRGGTLIQPAQRVAESHKTAKERAARSARSLRAAVVASGVASISEQLLTGRDEFQHTDDLCACRRRRRCAAEAIAICGRASPAVASSGAGASLSEGLEGLEAPRRLGRFAHQRHAKGGLWWP